MVTSANTETEQPAMGVAPDREPGNDLASPATDKFMRGPLAEGV